MSTNYFTQPTMDQLVAKQLAANPAAAGHTNSIVVGFDPTTGANVAAHFVLNPKSGKWELSANVTATYNPWTDRVAGSASVVFSW